MDNFVLTPVEPWLRLPRWSRIPAAALWQRVAQRRRSQRYAARDPRPVIAVGNLQVGGTGKTPMTLWLLTWLRQQGYHPGMVSRGYGRQGTQILRVDPAGDAARYGDEPLIVARTGFPVAVGADRAAAGHLLAEADVLVLDDGLQQKSLHPDLSLLLWDPARTGSDAVMPLGILREPLAALAEADLLLWRADTGGDLQLCKAIDLANKHDIPVVQVGYGDVCLTALTDRGEPGSRPLLAAGVGNRATLMRGLSELGLAVVDAGLRDHEPWGSATVRRLRRQIEDGQHTSLLITAKDEVKRNDWDSAFVVPVLRVASTFGPCRDADRSLLEARLRDLLNGFHG